MDNKKTVLSRRRIIKGTSVIATVGVVGGAATLYGSQPAVAASMTEWNASDLLGAEGVQSDDGTLTAVNTAPGIEIDWNNFADGADSVDITITARLPAPANGLESPKSDIIYHATGITGSTSGIDGVLEVITDEAPLDGNSTNGGVTVNLDAIDITDAYAADGSTDTEAITEDDFTDPDSSTATQITTVELELSTAVNGAQSETPTATAIATFQVEVKNLAETQETGGTANTSAE